jgi:hypothetical protein
MSPRLDTWTPKGQQILRRGRDAKSVRDGLVVGVHQPDSTNTGVLPGVNLTPHSGNIVVNTPGTVVEYLDIQGFVQVNAANCIIRNCRIRGLNSSPGTQDTNLISCVGASVSNLLIEDCTIAPDYPHWNWDSGITGHDFTARRNDIHHCTDGINVFYVGAPQPYQSNVIIEQNYIHDLPWWSASTSGVVHPSDTQTHNDCIQHQGGLGTVIRGNTLSALNARQYGHWVYTNGSEPYAFAPLHSLPDGGPYVPVPDRGAPYTEATGRYNWGSLACLMVNDNVGPSYDLTITDNWFYGGNYALNAGAVAHQASESFGSVLRNKFSRDQGAQSSGGDMTLTIQLGSGWTGWVNSGVGTSDANIYMDNGHEVRFRIAP